MKFWIITDTHLGHKNLCLPEYNNRPDNFTERILVNIAHTVTPDDVLIHLGDICMGNDIYWNKSLVDSIPGKRWLVRGNHDKKSDTWYLAHGWDFVADWVGLNKFGKRILLSHIPMAICDWDVNIHGHFHNNDHRTYEKELVSILTTKHKLLAVENTGYMPVNLEKFLR